MIPESQDSRPYKVGKGKPPGAHFSSGNQPAGELKSKGRRKKLRAQELVRAVLAVAAKSEKVKAMRAEAAEYFGMKEKDLNIEVLMIYKQIHKALEEGSTIAFREVMDRGYGKAVQRLNFDFITPPEPTQIKVTEHLYITI